MADMEKLHKQKSFISLIRKILLIKIGSWTICRREDFLKLCFSNKFKN